VLPLIQQFFLVGRYMLWLFLGLELFNQFHEMVFRLGSCIQGFDLAIRSNFGFGSQLSCYVVDS
jgi:hypothetical protein